MFPYKADLLQETEGKFLNIKHIFHEIRKCIYEKVVIWDKTVLL